jgi:hypothetical protein
MARESRLEQSREDHHREHNGVSPDLPAMEPNSVYFPEPTTADESWLEWDETMTEWLTRSSQPQARAMRNFLNKSLACFTRAHAESLAKKLHQNWHSYFFELVVGRYLQILGAELVAEPLGWNGTRVDYQATFAGDIVVSVECVSKRFNQKAQRTIELQGHMGRMLDGVGPNNWAIEIRRLPEATSPDEFQPYAAKAEEFYSTLPEPTHDDQHFHFAFDGPRGRMELQAIPFHKGTKANHFGPAVAFFDDSIVRLKNALIDAHKRKQARGALPPVLLAVDSPFNGPDAEDFDQALFGQTVDYRGRDRRSVGTSFNPTGLLVTDKDIPFAGVLAFLNVSTVGAAEPVLYLNPYQRWQLPTEISSHETRVWTSAIEKTPAARAPTIGLVGLVE